MLWDAEQCKVCLIWRYLWTEKEASNSRPIKKEYAYDYTGIVASDSNDINLSEEDALSRFRRKDDELEGFIT